MTARLLRAVAALGLGLAGALLVVVGGSSPAYAAACTGSTGVTVITDFKQLGGGVQGTCLAGGGGRKAAPLFEQAGFEQRYATRQPGFVCRVDEKPASDPCVNTSPGNAYWSLWWSDGDRGSTWVYSSLGVQSLTVPDGGLVAWSWDEVPGNVPPDADPERPASGQPVVDDTPATPTPPATGGGSGGGTSTGNGGGGGTGGGAGSGPGRGGSDRPDRSGDGSPPTSGPSGSPGSPSTGSDDGGTTPSPSPSAEPSAGPSASTDPDEAGDPGRDRPGRRGDTSGSRPSDAPSDSPTDEPTRPGTSPTDPGASEFPELVEPDAAPASSEAAPAGEGGLPSWVPLTAILALFVAAGGAALVRRRSSAGR